MLPKVRLTRGVWYWKDDTNTLEFESSSPADEEKLKERKSIKSHELCDETLKSIFQDITLGDKEANLHEPPKWEQHDYVTLDDVKYAALRLKEANVSRHMLSFAAVMRNEQLDEFLMALFFYLSFYLEKDALEKKYRSLKSTMIYVEKKEMADVLAKLSTARIHLAKAYSKLILGGHVAQQHHMPSGKRKTSLQKDRSFFEGFYNFCTYMAWLVFRKKHFQEIQEEIGRLLCSDMFNPALRDRGNVGSQKPRDQPADANTARLPYLRKARAKHPSIHSMIHQRSPLLSTLLPLPKDRAQYLSQGRHPQPCTRDNLPDLSELFSTKIGIIGAPRSELKSLTSMRDGMMENKEEQEGGKIRSSFSILTNDFSLPPLRRPPNRLSRQSTVLSKAMAEDHRNQRN